MNKTQLLLNEIKLNPGVKLIELEGFASANDIKTYKGLITKAKNQGMLILEGEGHTITDKGIEYLATDTKKKTNANKGKRQIVLQDREQQVYNLQQELIHLFNDDNLSMNTLKKNRIVQICNRMIALGEKSKNHNEGEVDTIGDNKEDNR